MTDVSGPWDDYADPAPAAPAPQPQPAPVSSPAPAPIQLAQPGAAPPPPPAEPGPWDDFSDQSKPTTQNLPIAPTAHNEIGHAFRDQMPPQVAHKMSADDEKAYSNLLKTADAATLKQFLWDHGGFESPGIDAYVINRDRARAKGVPVSYDVTYALPKVHNADGATGATLRGGGRGATFNFLDEAGAVADALGGTPGRPNIWNSKDSFGDLYDRNVDYNRGILAADDEDHPYASAAGEIAGGLITPVGLEKAGVTASLDAVRIAARNAAIMEGYTEQQAASIAARAVTRRLATEGAAYGGAYGVGSGDGDLGQRIESGVTGAVTGGALPVVGHVVAPVLRPVLNPIRAKGADIVNSIYDIGRRVMSPFTREGAQDRAADILRGSATRPIDDVLSDIRDAPTPVDGVQPTLAEVAGDAGLAGLQRGHANTDLNTAAAVGERNAANALARTRAASDVLGDGSPQALQDYAGGRLSTAERATADQQAAAQAAVDQRLATGRQTATAGRQGADTNLTEAVTRLGPTADRDATGAAARDAFDQAYEAAKDRTRTAYADPALNKPRPVNIPQSVFLKLRQAADNFYGDGGGEIPQRLQSIISDMADPNATTRTLTNIDRRLADFAGEAQMQGRRSEAAFAQRIRGDLGGFVQKGTPPEYRAALQNAKAVRADQGRVFETGDAASTFTRDRYGNPNVGNTAVPTRLARPGAAGGDTAEGLIQAIGPENAENIIRQEIRRAAEEKGIQTAAQARAFSTRYGEAAKRFPALRADLNNLEARAGELDAARGVESDAMAAKPSPEEVASTKQLSALHANILSTPLARIADTSADPASFVKGLMQRSDGGRQLRMLTKQVAGNDDAMGGLRRALGDYIIDAGAGPNFTAAGDRIPSINKTRAAIDTVIKRSGDALTNQQKIVLNQVQRELESANFAATASKPAGSETSINKTFVDLISHVPGVPGEAKSLLKKVLGSLGNGEEVKSLITESILNPDFAATLLKRPTERHWAQVKQGIVGRKLVMGNAIVGQPANDRYGLHELMLSAYHHSFDQAAASENEDDHRQIPPNQNRQAGGRQ